MPVDNKEGLERVKKKDQEEICSIIPSIYMNNKYPTRKTQKCTQGAYSKHWGKCL